jgi:rubredoxin
MMLVAESEFSPVYSCPDCGFPVCKAGKGWSGKNRPQRYRCKGCGNVYTGEKKLKTTGGKQ